MGQHGVSRQRRIRLSFSEARDFGCFARKGNGAAAADRSGIAAADSAPDLLRQAVCRVRLAFRRISADSRRDRVPQQPDSSRSRQTQSCTPICMCVTLFWTIIGNSPGSSTGESCIEMIQPSTWPWSFNSYRLDRREVTSGRNTVFLGPPSCDWPDCRLWITFSRFCDTAAKSTTRI